MKRSDAPEGYNRMAPTYNSLVDILRHYSQIDYGVDAYPLSAAEAALLVNRQDSYKNSNQRDEKSVMTSAEGVEAAPVLEKIKQLEEKLASVRYGFAALSEGIQAHQKEHQKLEAENAALRAEVERLKEFEFMYKELCK